MKGIHKTRQSESFYVTVALYFAPCFDIVCRLCTTKRGQATLVSGSGGPRARKCRPVRRAPNAAAALCLTISSSYYMKNYDAPTNEWHLGTWTIAVIMSTVLTLHMYFNIRCTFFCILYIDAYQMNHFPRYGKCGEMRSVSANAEWCACRFLVRPFS